MPYKPFKKGGKWQVFKLDADGKPTGKALGTHEDEAAAKAQVKALYASENKEISEDDLTKMMNEAMPYYYAGPTSFAEMEAMEEAREKAGEIEKMAYSFPDMAMAIIHREDIADKEAALTKLGQEFADRVQAKAKEAEKKERSFTERVTSVVKSLFGKVEEKPQEQTFFLWKEAGEYHWLARYSNNMLDNDNPPDIISEASHKRFVDLVDKGLTPLPELWLWHVPEWKWGQATGVAYDDSGYAIATGTIDKGCEPLAEWVLSQKEMGVSHGMPKETIKRDEADPKIITEHVTREISPLFLDKAANKRTDFFIIPKEQNTMAIPEQKKAELIAAGLQPETLAALEAKNASDAKEAKESGVITKETEPAQPAEPPKVEATETALTLEAITEAISPAFKLLADEIASLKAEVKELKQTDEAKIAEKAANVPKASLEAMVQERLFGPATQIDGRNALVKQGPKETKPEGKEDEQLFFEKWLARNQVGVRQ